MLIMNLRKKIGPIVAGSIVAFIALIFIFTGVYNPRTTGGRGEGSNAGTVDGEAIALADFRREYERQIEFYRSLMGGKISEAQIAAFGLRRNVFNDLARRQMMRLEAEKVGMSPSDEEIRDQLREDPNFQKDGHFDPQLYKKLLQANQFSPAVYEMRIRQFLSMQSWSRFFDDRMKVSPEELRREYMIQKEKRQVKYVLLSTKTLASKLNISAGDVAKIEKDEAKVKLAKARFEARKATDFKGKKFEQVKASLFREMAAESDGEGLKKLQDQLAQELMTAQVASKAVAVAKAKGISVESAGMIARSATFIPGLGDTRELLHAVFDAGYVSGTLQKVRVSGDAVAIAWAEGKEGADMAQFETDKKAVLDALKMKKMRTLQDEWMQKLSTQYKVVMNSDVVEPAQTKE